MGVQNVLVPLTAAIEETLGYVVTDEEVFYHLEAISTWVECSGGAEGEPEEPHLRETMVWRVNLHVSHGGRYADLNGTMPYVMCSDGDPGPMKDLVREIWNEYSFARLARESGLDGKAGAETPAGD
jgi:hypothetical protein